MGLRAGRAAVADVGAHFDAAIHGSVRIVRDHVGRKDPRVVIDHAEKLRARMKKAEKSFDWLVKNNEGHGFRKEENRLELYSRIEKFLGDNL